MTPDEARRRRDRGEPAPDPALLETRQRQDAMLAERHRGFDLSAQDTHMKYERPSFVVVTASPAYRAGWERIFGTASQGDEP